MVGQFKFKLDGVETNAPINWQGLQVLASFDQSSTQANITTEEFEFVNESAQIIRKYLMGGLSLATFGIFDGIPYEISYDNGTNSVEIFQGYLDFNTYEEISPVRVKCSVKKTNGLNGLDDRSRANSFGYLEDEGFITDADYVDVDYLVEKLNVESDVALVTLALFLLTVQIAKSVSDIKKNQAIATAITLSSPPISAPAGTGAFTSTMILDIAYLTLLVIQAVTLIRQMANLLMPPIRTHKGMRLRTMMDKASDYLGYTYDSNLTELDNIVYLPSKPSEDNSIVKGIPNASDYGYQLSEAMELVNRVGYAKILLKDGTIFQRTLGDPFWINNSTYVLPDVLDERKKYNNADFKARTFVNFMTDQMDDWTIDQFTGTNYEVITTPINGEKSPTNLMSGLDDVSIPMALGNGKEKLSEIEEFFLKLFEIVDFILTPVIKLVNTIVSIFGGTNTIPLPNFAGIILKRLGVLRVSQKIHSVAKLIYLNAEGRIPSNQRQLFSAKVLWDKYYNYGSFVSNDFGGQRRIYEQRKIPFGFSDFLKCIDNSYFTTADGRSGKIEEIKWTLDGDYAIVDYWIEEVYTTNLEENFIEG